MMKIINAEKQVLNLKLLKCMMSVLLLTFLAMATFPLRAEAAPSAYVHNPVLNAKAMNDIVVDDAAIYGFSPDPESERIGVFADMDWSDPEVVEKGRQERIAYHNSFATMYDTWKQMEANGSSVEEIARKVSEMRNEIRLESYNGDPEGLAKAKASNLEKYGNENGPTPESLYAKYGNWKIVLIKAFSENPGMDACLGLYDEYYDIYAKVGSLEESSRQTYTVRKNDNLSKIAKKYYGDRAKWKAIYDQNLQTISDPNRIYVGQTLTIVVE